MGEFIIMMMIGVVVVGAIICIFNEINLVDLLIYA